MLRKLLATVLTVTVLLYGVNPLCAHSQENKIPLEQMVYGTWECIFHDRPPLEITRNSISQGFWGMNSVTFKPLTEQIVGILESNFRGESDIVLIPDDDGSALGAYNRSNNKTELYYKIPKLPNEIKDFLENSKSLITKIQGKWQTDNIDNPDLEIGSNWYVIGNKREKGIAFKPLSKSIVAIERNGVRLDHTIRLFESKILLFVNSENSKPPVEYSRVK